MLPDDLVGPVVVHTGEEILYANSAFRTVVDVDPTCDLAGASLSEFVHPRFRDALRSQCDRVAQEGTPALGTELEVQSATADESNEAVAVTSRVDWEGQTRLQTTFITIGDERLWSGSPLKEQAMHEAPVGITIADATREDEPLVYVNDGFVELTGYPREEIIGRNCRFLQGPDTREEPVAQMRTAIDAGEAVTVDLRNYRKDGTMFWNRVSISPITDETGTVTHFLGFQQDVSKRTIYKHEKTLFEKYAESATTAMFATDRDGTIEYVNPAFERITGYSAAEAIGQTPRILKSGDHDEEFYTELWDTITAGDIWEAEITNRAKSGERYQAKQTIVPVTDDSGEVTDFVAIQRDITDEQLTEQVLDVMNRVMRHNLRTSVSVIEGYATLLETNVETTEQQAAARTIRKRASALHEISEQTATIRQLLRGHDEPRPIEVKTIRQFVDGYQSDYEEAQITLSIETDPQIKLTNGPVLELALKEAVENAVVHNDQETPMVDLTVAPTEDDPDTITIEIADNGPGIPDEEWAIIKTGQEAPLSHSLGLGLWLIYWAVTALGGDVTRTENTPRGTVLQLRLPIFSPT